MALPLLLCLLDWLLDDEVSPIRDPLRLQPITPPSCSPQFIHPALLDLFSW